MKKCLCQRIFTLRDVAQVGPVKQTLVRLERGLLGMRVEIQTLS